MGGPVLMGGGRYSRNLPLQDLELLPLQHLQVPVIHGRVVKQGHHKMLL